MLQEVNVNGRRISLEELQRAVMDLGLFPTTSEIARMHRTLGPNAETRVSKSTVKFEDGADVEEFLNMVMVLSVKEMGRGTIEQLHRLFVQHADEEERLWRDDLSKLMKTLNHPEDEVELEVGGEEEVEGVVVTMCGSPTASSLTAALETMCGRTQMPADP